MDNDTNNNSVQPDVQPGDQLFDQPIDQPVITSMGDAAPEAPVQSMDFQAAPKKKKTGLIIGIIAAVLLIGGLVGAYFWYQSPNKVVADAINKSNSAKIIKTKIKLSQICPNLVLCLKVSDLEMEMLAILKDGVWL